LEEGDSACIFGKEGIYCCAENMYALKGSMTHGFVLTFCSRRIFSRSCAL
jgi:hypothetical protein